MNGCHIYSIWNNKGKVLCVIQYKFNVLVNSPQASINTNYTLLASSNSTSMTWKDSRSDTNVKGAMEADATSGKNKLYKNFIYNELTLTYASAYIEKMVRNIKEYISHILRYMNIYEYM